MFYNDDDKRFFMKQIKKSKNVFNYSIYSYCLMTNHIHFVFRVEDEFLSKVMQSITMKYSIYFNKKYNHIGHVFQDRYYSKNVESVRYFLTVCKYIHRNPEKAKIDKTDSYYWSSYREYVGREEVIDKKVLMCYFNNDIKLFKKYMLENDDITQIFNQAEYELKKKLTDEEVNLIICKKFRLSDASNILNFDYIERRNILKELIKIKGTSLNQISRITKVSAYIIKKIWEDD